MPFIGRQPQIGNYIKCDAITTSATTTFNLTAGSVAVYPQTATNCIVSLNGVIQAPTDAYTISGSQIIFASALTTSDVIDFITVLGDVLSIGTPTNGTVTTASLASGTSGLVAWQSVQTTGFTAVAGRGYPCNTTSAAFTVTLPASATAGDTIVLVDYAGTFATNNITLGANGNKINGATDNKALTTNREAVTITYVDSTQGWVASSGTNYGTQSLDPGPYSIDFLVIAGGGGASFGGGGAGGYRTSTQTISAGKIITVTVGGGGASRTNGSDSSISATGLTTITSTGGGRGGGAAGNAGTGANGGSGGGGGHGTGSSGSTGDAGGTGNTPSTSPSQGNAGGYGRENPNYAGGGGGGAGAVGANAAGTGTTSGGAGGNGTASSITGSSVTYAGGGGGAYSDGTSGGIGGTGGGGRAGTTTTGSGDADGTANTGGGAGGANGGGKSGGSGVVILSLPTSSYSGTTAGFPTVTTSGSNTILKFTGSGSYTT